MDERVNDHPDVATNGERVYTISGRNMLNNANTESKQNLVPVTTKGSIFRKKFFYRNVSISLLVVIILLIIGIITLSCLYLKAVHYLSDAICQTEDCLRSAANLRLSMDLSVDPCEDFYNYTCGKWTDEHINHGWYSRFSSFETISERITVATLNFLKSNVSKAEPLPVTQSRDLYKSCMDVDSINKLGYTVIYKYLNIVNLSVVPKIFNATKDELESYQFDWVKADVDLKKVLSKDLFVQFLIDSDIYNRNKNVMYLGSTRSPSPLPSPFKDIFPKHKPKPSTADADLEKKYEEMYKKVARGIMMIILTNASSIPEANYLNESVDLLWNFTKKLSDLAGDEDYDATIDEDEDDLDIRKMTVDQLQNLTDIAATKDKLNKAKVKDIWKRYLNLMFDDIDNVTLDFKTDYLYYLPSEVEYITSAVVLLAKTPGVILEFYAWYQTVYSMIINTSTQVVNFIYGQSTEYRDSTVLRSRSMNCAESVVARFMGIAVSYGIVDKAFLNSTKPKVETMLENIKIAFVDRVKTITWMDPGTKEATLEKSSEMISFIGFPEWLLNKTALEMYYSNITIKNDTYLENMISIIRARVPYHLASLREENPRTWNTDPITVNAYNYFGDNSINVPVAILSFPIYYLGLEVLNYGAFGSVLGHELTHGFDNTGRKFDKFGNFRQWWSNDTITTFEEKTECFIEQYNNFTLPNIKESVNGKVTLGENLADNGGLNHAFLAYKNYVKQNGEEKLLPGFQDYTSEQLFFIAYASVYCETPSRQALIDQLKTDEHSPNPIRVLGALQNSDDFAKAFSCPKGSRMNPDKEKCRIW